jgi:hypothetical protein
MTHRTRATVLAAACLLTIGLMALAAREGVANEHPTFTWTGGPNDVTNQNQRQWSRGDNWQDGAAPSEGSAVVFPAPMPQTGDQLFAALPHRSEIVAQRLEDPGRSAAEAGRPRMLRWPFVDADEHELAGHPGAGHGLSFALRGGGGSGPTGHPRCRRRTATTVACTWQSDIRRTLVTEGGT